uniref:Uncharacterized protein n=1 Tax=Glossina brevipalpis TaxID=37001 RepID=A0A1A9WUG1_9MUSC
MRRKNINGKRLRKQRNNYDYNQIFGILFEVSKGYCYVLATISQIAGSKKYLYEVLAILLISMWLLTMRLYDKFLVFRSHTLRIVNMGKAAPYKSRIAEHGNLQPKS